MNLPDAQQQFPHRRFCALEYRPSSLDVTIPAEGPILVIVYSDAGGSLSILVDPKWRIEVLENDKETIGLLLETFMERARLEPRQLLKQLSELNFGCLVTAATEKDSSKEPLIMALMKQFVNPAEQ